MQRQSEDWLTMTYQTTTAKTNREGSKDKKITASLDSRKCPSGHPDMRNPRYG